MSLHLVVQYASRRACPDRAQLRRWVKAALSGAGVVIPAELVLRFCDQAEARRLNRAYRGRDYATNVLTFAHEATRAVCADIVLCAPVLEREARAQKKPVLSHTAHLVIHGTLHALGYDHESARAAEEMESLEKAILARFSIPDPYE
ncbi:MAG: rRNA maturation RNase YbeY [Burkholderiaceae bacterium]